jgi:hypothetical protein
MLFIYVLQNYCLSNSFISAKSAIAVKRSDVFVFSSSEFSTSSISSTSDFKKYKLRNLIINGAQIQSARSPWGLNFEQCHGCNVFS